MLTRRRHRLPGASLEQLPVGRWVTVGPYTAAEWAARGEHASGKGAFLQLNKTAYLAAVETGDGAAWRLKDVAARTGHGLLAIRSARTLAHSRVDALAAVRDRYATLMASIVDPTPLARGDHWRVGADGARRARRLGGDVAAHRPRSPSTRCPARAAVGSPPPTPPRPSDSNCSP